MFLLGRRFKKRDEGYNLLKNMQHCRRRVHVVKDHSQRSDFYVIDVRYALLDGNLLFCKLEMSVLDIHFAGHIPGDAGELVPFLVISFS